MEICTHCRGGLFIGNLNFSIIFSKIVFNKDIRNYGSGNAGTTNTFRTFGPLLGDDRHALGRQRRARRIPRQDRYVRLYRTPAAVLAALFVAIGHVYPVIFASAAARAWPPSAARC